MHDTLVLGLRRGEVRPWLSNTWIVEVAVVPRGTASPTYASDGDRRGVASSRIQEAMPFPSTPFNHDIFGEHTPREQLRHRYQRRRLAGTSIASSIRPVSPNHLSCARTGSAGSRAGPVGCVHPPRLPMTSSPTYSASLATRVSLNSASTSCTSVSQRNQRHRSEGGSGRVPGHADGQRRKRRAA